MASFCENIIDFSVTTFLAIFFLFVFGRLNAEPKEDDNFIKKDAGELASTISFVIVQYIRSVCFKSKQKMGVRER
jgi:hypothetical protein